ncbi:hypothetical protein IMSAG025_02217 [Muribaculaceae bacterium]|nr:hypothetical protein IMSAG025_02217 [Muribaculaceae bacterium]
MLHTYFPHNADSFLNIGLIGNLHLHIVSDIFRKIGINNHRGIHDGIGHNTAFSVKLVNYRVTYRHVFYNSLGNHSPSLNNPYFLIHIIRLRGG